MGALLLLEKPASSREALARELREHLGALGVDYHVRTLKRQLTGSVSSVPPEVEAAMRHLLLRANGLRTDGDIEQALGAAGLWVAPRRARADVPLHRTASSPWPSSGCCSTRPTHNGPSPWCSPSGWPGAAFNLRSTRFRTSSLGDNPSLAVRSERSLLALLSAHGIGSEAEAGRRWQQHQQDIAAYLEDRALVPAGPLVDLARAWKLRNHQPSSRHLAVVLQHELGDRGLDLGLHQIQVALDGRAKHVRHALIAELEGLLREGLPEGHDLASEVAACRTEARQIDLCWVKAEPISALATAWLAGAPRRDHAPARPSRGEVGAAHGLRDQPEHHPTDPQQATSTGRAASCTALCLSRSRAARSASPRSTHRRALGGPRQRADLSPPVEPKSQPTAGEALGQRQGGLQRRSAGRVPPKREGPVGPRAPRRRSSWPAGSKRPNATWSVSCSARRSRPGELAAIGRKLDEGELSPWDVVVGARPDGEAANRQAHRRAAPRSQARSPGSRRLR